MIDVFVVKQKVWVASSTAPFAHRLLIITVKNSASANLVFAVSILTKMSAQIVQCTGGSMKITCDNVTKYIYWKMGEVLISSCYWFCGHSPVQNL